MFVKWDRLQNFVHREWFEVIKEEAKTNPPNDPQCITVQFSTGGIINVIWSGANGTTLLGFARIFKQP